MSLLTQLERLGDNVDLIVHVQQHKNEFSKCMALEGLRRFGTLCELVFNELPEPQGTKQIQSHIYIKLSAWLAFLVVS